MRFSWLGALRISSFKYFISDSVARYWRLYVYNHSKIINPLKNHL